jgi:arylsulfatase A-like enzyme
LPDAEREKLAAGGLKYNRFHTTALCSPSRQTLLTGRNHHSAGMGGITEIEVPKSDAEGVIIAQGANIGGWSLYAKGGKLKYC